MAPRSEGVDFCQRTIEFDGRYNADKIDHPERGTDVRRAVVLAARVDSSGDYFAGWWERAESVPPQPLSVASKLPFEGRLSAPLIMPGPMKVGPPNMHRICCELAPVSACLVLCRTRACQSDRLVGWESALRRQTSKIQCGGRRQSLPDTSKIASQSRRILPCCSGTAS